MKNKNLKKVRRGVASFGAAMASLSLTHYADAGIIDLTPNLNASQPFQGSAPAGSIQAILGGPIDFFQFNDTIGKTINVLGNLVGIRNATYSNAITTGMAFSNIIRLGLGSSGVRTFGFLTAANQVGWIRMDLGGAAGAITYLAAAFNDTPGGDIHAGRFEEFTSAVPEPSSAALAGLGALALGAVSLRKMRRKQTAA